MNSQVRKLQVTADGTYFITLPKAWVTRIGGERGTLLKVSVEDHGLVIKPYDEVKREIKAVALSLSPLLQRELEEKYLLGFDVITVESKDIIPMEVRDAVKKTIKRFVGLEILEEDSRRMAIQCIIEPSMLIPERIIRRLHTISQAMQRDAIASFVNRDAKLAKTVLERDEEVDRIYFLLVRVVRGAVQDPLLAKKLETSPIDCLDYRVLASFIEGFADQACFMAANIPEGIPDATDWEMMAGAVNKAGVALNLAYAEAVEAVLLRDLERATSLEGTLSELDGYIKSLGSNLNKIPHPSFEKLTSTIRALEAMRGIIADIADLAISR